MATLRRTNREETGHAAFLSQIRCSPYRSAHTAPLNLIGHHACYVHPPVPFPAMPQGSVVLAKPQTDNAESTYIDSLLLTSSCGGVEVARMICLGDVRRAFADATCTERLEIIGMQCAPAPVSVPELYPEQRRKRLTAHPLRPVKLSSNSQRLWNLYSAATCALPREYFRCAFV
jgi:hypothetical protein